MVRKKRAGTPLAWSPAQMFPKNFPEPESHVVKGSTERPSCRVRASHEARKTPSRDVVSDTIAFGLFTAAVVAVIIASCILTTLGWPS